MQHFLTFTFITRGCLSSWLHPHTSAPCDAASGWGSACTCFWGFPLRHQNRRPRFGRRERCGASGAMDYQQKLAEKLVILNERGSGVLIRMNYIKKVRASTKTSLHRLNRNQKKELCSFLTCFNTDKACQFVKLLHKTRIYLTVNMSKCRCLPLRHKM